MYRIEPDCIYCPTKLAECLLRYRHTIYRSYWKRWTPDDFKFSPAVRLIVCLSFSKWKNECVLQFSKDQFIFCSLRNWYWAKWMCVAIQQRLICVLFPKELNFAKSPLPVTLLSGARLSWNVAEVMAVIRLCSVQHYNAIEKHKLMLWMKRFHGIWFCEKFLRATILQQIHDAV